MEQVDKDINVRCKDEPQRNMAEDIVESFGFKAESYRQAKAKTEPQAEIKGSKRLLKGSDEPQQKSCATCKHALGNWDGESNNCGRCCGADRRFYEPKDEPQTESTGSPIGDYRDGVGAWQTDCEDSSEKPNDSKERSSK